MKLVFSETRSDYARYTYPYVVWAFPEEGETPADFYEKGFLPGAPDLSRFYLCRNLRVLLGRYVASSENRRVLRKGDGIACELVPRAAFDDSPARRAAWKAYADQRFGEDVMSHERLDRLMASALVSHLLVFRETATGVEVGAALLHLQGPRVAHYCYAFYDLGRFRQNLGMFMMTAAVEHFAKAGFAAIHLGTCYSEKALYKTQFAGVEFFNGVGWSADLAELRHLIRREQGEPAGHLLESADYLAEFWEGSVANVAARSGFHVVR